MAKYSNEELQAVVNKEYQNLEQAKQQAGEQFLHSRVIGLALENTRLRDLLAEHAPAVYAEFNAPDVEEEPEKDTPPAE